MLHYLTLRSIKQNTKKFLMYENALFQTKNVGNY